MTAIESSLSFSFDRSSLKAATSGLNELTRVLKRADLAAAGFSSGATNAAKSVGSWTNQSKKLSGAMGQQASAAGMAAAASQNMSGSAGIATSGHGLQKVKNPHEDKARERRGAILGQIGAVDAEIAGLGKTAAEAELLRLNQITYQDLRREADENGRPDIDQAQYRDLQAENAKLALRKQTLSQRKAMGEMMGEASQFISKQRLGAQVLGMSTQAAAALSHEYNFLNKARQAGIVLSDTERAALHETANAMAAEEESTRKAKEAYDDARSQTKGFIVDTVKGLREGKSATDAFIGAMNNLSAKMVSKVEDRFADSIVNLLFTSKGDGKDFLARTFGGKANADTVALNGAVAHVSGASGGLGRALPGGGPAHPWSVAGAADSGWSAGLSDRLVNAVKGFEGFTPQAKWDNRQYSIGYGTRSVAGEVITRDVADARLREELQSAQAAVDKFARDIPAGIRDALTSLTYNTGQRWMSSGLGDAIRAGDYETAKQRFLQYNRAGGKVLPGLVERRQMEASWFDAGAGGVSAPLGGKSAGLNDEFAARLQAFQTAAQAAGYDISVSSGYRSIAEQQRLWDASDKTGRTVAAPGKSYHNYGLAADLKYGPGARDWAQQNASTYGLSYPMGYEPWHIEPSGVRGAGSAAAASLQWNAGGAWPSVAAPAPVMPGAPGQPSAVTASGVWPSAGALSAAGSCCTQMQASGSSAASALDRTAASADRAGTSAAGLGVGTQNATDAANGFAGGLGGALQQIMSGLGSVLSGVMNVAGGLVKDGGDLLSGMLGAFTGWGVHAATGGLIRGPGTATSDSVPAMLSRGEFVVNAAAAGRYGPLLQAINDNSVSRLAAAGRVSRPAAIRMAQYDGRTIMTPNSSGSPPPAAPQIAVHNYAGAQVRAETDPTTGRTDIYLDQQVSKVLGKTGSASQRQLAQAGAKRPPVRL